jgi:hypothetical protein
MMPHVISRAIEGRSPLPNIVWSQSVKKCYCTFHLIVKFKEIDCTILTFVQFRYRLTKSHEVKFQELAIFTIKGRIWWLIIINIENNDLVNTWKNKQLLFGL